MVDLGHEDVSFPMGLVGTGRRSGCGYGGCLLLTVKKKKGVVCICYGVG